MEGSDDQHSDEVIQEGIDEKESPIPDSEISRLEARIRNLEKVTRNFKITGDGISGDFESGFLFNPPTIQGTDTPEESE